MTGGYGGERIKAGEVWDLGNMTSGRRCMSRRTSGAQASPDEIGDNENERDEERDEEGERDADTREGDERRSFDFARLELLAQPVGLLARVGGETLRLFAKLAVQVNLGVAAARGALRGLVAPLTLISHVAPFRTRRSGPSIS